MAVIGYDCFCIVKLAAQSLREILATVVALAVQVGTASASFDSLSVMTILYRFLALVFGNGPNMSIATNSIGRAERKWRNSRCLLLFWQFFAHG